MVFKILTTKRCALCKKEIDYKDIRAGRKYFCSKRHRDEYIRMTEIRRKALGREGPGTGKGCCG